MYRLRTLGGLRLERDGELHVGPASQRRRIALLVLLAGSRGNGVSRDKLVAYVWPESHEQRARHSLDDALSALRRELHHEALFLGVATLTLNPEALPSDIAEFDQALASDELERAVGLYTGPFLDGFHLSDAPTFERWVDAERDRVAGAHARAVETLATRAASAGDHEAAERWWRQAVTADPLNVRAMLGLLHALAVLGQRPEALRMAQLHETLLRRDFQAEPDAEILKIVEALRAGAMIARRPGTAAPPSSGVADAPSLVVAPVAAAAGGATPRAALLARIPRAGRVLAGFAALMTVGAIGVGVAAKAGWLSPRRAAAPRLDDGRVVVKRFENASGDARWDALTLMASDAVSYSLTRAGFDVVSTPWPSVAAPGTSSERIPASGDSAVLSLARATGARMAVSGAIYAQGDSLRLQPRVTDARSGQAVGSVEPVIASSADPSRAVQEMSERVLGSLAAVLNPQVAAWTKAAAKPRSLAAYEEFAAGQAAWPDYSLALTHFRRAVALDSTFAMAQIEIATASRMLGQCARTDSIGHRLMNRGGELAPFERLMIGNQMAACYGDQAGTYETARLMRERLPDSPVAAYSLILAAMDQSRLHEALALLDGQDPERAATLIGPTFALAHAIVLHVLGRHARELAVLDAALRRFPAQAVLMHQRLNALAALGRIDELDKGVAQLLALPVDTLVPGRTSVRDVALDLSIHGHAREADALRQRALAGMGRAGPGGRARRELPEFGELLYDVGRFADAEQVFRREVALDSGDVVAHGWLAVAGARLGDSATAAREDAWLTRRRDPYDVSPALFRARLAAVLGRRDEAVAFFREWSTHTIHHLHVFLHVPPDLDGLLGYPPLEALLRPKD